MYGQDRSIQNLRVYYIQSVEYLELVLQLDSLHPGILLGIWAVKMSRIAK